MNFDYYILETAQRAMDMNDVPDELLPLLIVSAVAGVGGLESDAPWSRARL